MKPCKIHHSLCSEMNSNSARPSYIVATATDSCICEVRDFIKGQAPATGCEQNVAWLFHQYFMCCSLFVKVELTVYMCTCILNQRNHRFACYGAHCFHYTLYQVFCLLNMFLTKNPGELVEFLTPIFQNQDFLYSISSKNNFIQIF